MSEPDFISRWAETTSDQLNPILVKETRQALKSRQFVATFSIMLFGSWLISAVVLLPENSSRGDAPVGGENFWLYYSLLALSVMLVVPFGAFRSLLAERDLNTYELLNITTLSPLQIVWGKWLSSQVQTFIYFSAISPFIAFIYLLRGVDFPTLMVTLLVTMLASMMLSLLSLTLSTFAAERQSQVVLSIVLLAGLVGAMYFSIRIASSWVSQSVVDLNGLLIDNAILWIVLICTAYYVSTFLLFLQIARAQLTFESDNRSTGIRIVCAVLLWLTVTWIGFVVLFNAASTGTADVTGVVSTMVWVGVFGGIVALFASTEFDALSRRNRGKLFRSPLLRLASLPFLPGGSRGLLFVTLNMAVLVALTYALGIYFDGAKTTPAAWEGVERFVAGLACYLVIVAAVSSLAGRWLRVVSPGFRPGQVRAVMIVFFALLWLMPNLINLLITDARRITSPYFFVTDPINTLSLLSAPQLVRGATHLLTILAAAAGLLLLFNVRAMWRGVVEVLVPQSSETSGQSASSTAAVEPISEPDVLEPAVSSEATASG